MNKSHTQESDTLSIISLLIGATMPMTWGSLILYNDFYIRNPNVVLTAFGVVWWPASYYIIYILVKSFPYKFFPNPSLKFPFEAKVYYGGKAKIAACICFLFLIPITVAPVVVYSYYSYVGDSLSSMKKSQNDYEEILEKLKAKNDENGEVRKGHAP